MLYNVSINFVIELENRKANIKDKNIIIILISNILKKIFVFLKFFNFTIYLCYSKVRKYENKIGRRKTKFRKTYS